MSQFEKKAVLEKTIEAQGEEYAEKRGWWCCKFTSPSLRGVPDRIYIRRGRVVFIEWKKFGEEPTAQQHKRHRDMRAHGAEVHWVDTLEEAMEILK